MLIKYLLFSFRNFRNQKLFTIVNLIGLTIGIIAASFIMIYVSYELSFDNFHKNTDRIFRVYSTFNSFTKEGVTEAWVQTPAPLANFLQNKFPEIEKTVRIAVISKGLVSSDEKSFFEDRMIIADSTLFEVFTYPLIAGSPKQLLAQPNSVVLSEATAKKYFGINDPLGKTIYYNRKIGLTITGIMKDLPNNTHLQFNMVASMSSAKAFFGDDFLENKMNTVTFLYLLANTGSDFGILNQAISKSTREYDEGDFGDNKLYHIQQLKSIHLHSNMGGEFMPNSDIKTIYILSSIAILILIVASINYINLSLSINNKRSTELGIRKILGARRRQLIFLYLTDSAVLVGISVILSTLIITSKEQRFTMLTGLGISYNYSLTSLLTGLAVLFIIITTITGLASGWISSNISPMDTLKKPLGKSGKNFRTQDVLVLFQFVISIILITTTLFIYRQMKFTQNKNLGFSKDQLMIIPLNENLNRSRLATLKQELLANPNILSVSATSDIPGKMIWVTSIFLDGQNEQSPSTISFLEIDKGFINTFRVHLIEGFMPGDTACPYSGTQYLLNESAVKKIGWSKPVGKKLSCYYGKDGFVTGVLGDFHFNSLHEHIEPLFLYMREENSRFLTLKLSTSDISTSVDFIHSSWNKIVIDSPFEYFFYDTFYDQLYRKETSFGKIILIFSIIAILIASMGLFGLAAFSSEMRTKEIGVRKVNGATIIEMVVMLIKEFLKWVFIAFILAVPIAWYITYKWLQTFAYKTEISWLVFCLAGIIAITIAIITVSWQSLKASLRNPVESLRYE
jgi:putative ABC transport system permease protein